MTQPVLDRRVSVAVIVTVLSFGSAFPAVKFALLTYSGGQVAFTRFLIASIALAVYARASRVKLPPAAYWWRLVPVSATGIVGYHLLFNFGQRHVSASAASVLVNTGPIWTSVFAAWLLAERPRPSLWLGMMISFAGAALIAVSERGSLQFSAGAVVVLFAAVVQSLSFVLQKPLVSELGATGVTTVVIWIGTLILAPFYGKSSVQLMLTAPGAATLAVAYVGLVSSVLGLVAWAFVLSEIPASRAAPFLLTVPVAAAAIAIPVLGELPNALTVVGAAITLAGVAVGQGVLRPAGAATSQPS